MLILARSCNVLQFERHNKINVILCNSVLKRKPLTGFLQSGKTGKSHGICVVREKSGKMILDHTDCRYM